MSTADHPAHDDGSLHHRSAAYVQANEQLRAAIVAIAARLDVIGHDIAADDSRVEDIAVGVRADLEALRPDAVTIAATRPYVIALPGGQFATDEALHDLDVAVARADAAIATRDQLRDSRRRAQQREAARADIADTAHHITTLTDEAKQLQQRYEATDADSRDGIEVRIRAYNLMRDLADARDAHNRARVAAGDLAPHAERSRRQANDEARAEAAAAIPVLTTKLAEQQP